MLFSILIPLYNTENYIAECLDSILAQSVKDYEILICDDASTDRGLEISRVYQRQYPEQIRIIENEKNQGLLLTRRRLFGEARGEWVICVDSDDWLLPDALTVLKDAINSYSADMVLYDLVCKHMDGGEQRFYCGLNAGYIYSGENKKAIYYKFLETYELNSMCTKAVKRSLIATDDCDYHQYSYVSNGEDKFQSFPLVDAAKNIVYIDNVLYQYRKNEGSISVSRKPNLYRMRRPLWEREDFYMEKWNLSQELRERRLVSRINEIVLILQDHSGKARESCMGQVKEDGLLKAYYRQIDPRKLRLRYRIVCALVLRGMYGAAGVFLDTMKALLCVKKCAAR